MKRIILVCFALLSINAFAQQSEVNNRYFQVKVDFLEPIVNQGFIIRGDYGLDKHSIGLFGGGFGRISEFDNAQFDTYEDETNFLIGLEYQYYLSSKKINKGFYIGGDFMFANRKVSSKVSSEEINNIGVFTPGAWFGYMWKPFKKAELYVDLTIVHPRYDFGKISKVDFQTVAVPYEPENLLNFLGPWSIAWRF